MGWAGARSCLDLRNSSLFVFSWSSDSGRCAFLSSACWLLSCDEVLPLTTQQVLSCDWQAASQWCPTFIPMKRRGGLVFTANCVVLTHPGKSEYCAIAFTLNAPICTVRKSFIGHTSLDNVPGIRILRPTNHSELSLQSAWRVRARDVPHLPAAWHSYGSGVDG